MFGVHCPPEGQNFTQMRQTCITTEKQGYDLFTMTDHLYPMRENSRGFPLECWTTMGGLAAVTERIKLGSLVSCMGYRNPALLGKIATTLDIISNGRLILGIGAGWHETEFKAYFGRFPSVKEREDTLEDAAQILHSMLHKKQTTFISERYYIEKLVNLPPPIQEAIPIMIGGSGERRTLRIAAKYGDISHINANSAEEIERKIEVLKGHCKRNGRDFSEITVATSLSPMIEGNHFQPQLRENIDTLIKLGVKIFTIRNSVFGDATLEWQKKFAEEVIPSFKA